MKHILLAASILFVLPVSAWNVSTEPTRRSALIEEFTGIQCPNCPDGHAVAATLMALHPGEVFPIAVHAGYFAVASGTQPDYVTPLGTAIHDHFGINSYPSAVVSRRPYGSRLVTSRSEWGSAAREAVSELSPVNLWTSLEYTESTRTVTLRIEGYLTEDMSDPRLNVFMLQSEILGPQKGGQLGNDYPHRHMLRARLTDADFGDPVEARKSGDYFTRTITYQLPEKVGVVEVDPRNVELVTFVTDGEENVCVVKSDRPETPGLEPLFAVSSAEPVIPIGKNYAFDFVEMWLHNHGGTPVTSADFDISLNDVKKTYSWEGEVPAHSSAVVRVPLGGDWDVALDYEGNSYVIRMTKANGTDVETASLRGKFNEIGRFPTEMNVVIKTDLDAADNTWRILDRNGDVVKEFGPYESGSVQEHTESVSLDEGEVYCLEVTDCWGDGVCHPNGSVRLTDASGKQVGQYKEIRGYGFRQFFRATSAEGVEDLLAGPASTEYYDISGRRISAPGEGVVIVRTLRADGSVNYEKRIK